MSERDELAEVIHKRYPEVNGWYLADVILASGVVIAASALADDDALVERVSRIWVARNHPRRPWRPGDVLPAKGWVRAVAAALTERGQGMRAASMAWTAWHKWLLLSAGRDPGSVVRGNGSATCPCGATWPPT